MNIVHSSAAKVVSETLENSSDKLKSVLSCTCRSSTAKEKLMRVLAIASVLSKKAYQGPNVGDKCSRFLGQASIGVELEGAHVHHDAVDSGKLHKGFRLAVFPTFCIARMFKKESSTFPMLKSSKMDGEMPMQ